MSYFQCILPKYTSSFILTPERLVSIVEVANLLLGEKEPLSHNSSPKPGGVEERYNGSAFPIQYWVRILGAATPAWAGPLQPGFPPLSDVVGFADWLTGQHWGWAHSAFDMTANSKGRWTRVLPISIFRQF